MFYQPRYSMYGLGVSPTHEGPPINLHFPLLVGRGYPQCMVHCLQIVSHLRLMSFNHKNQPNIGRYTIHGSWILLFNKANNLFRKQKRISSVGSWKILKKTRPFWGLKKSKSIDPEDLFGKPVLYFLLGKCEMWNKHLIKLGVSQKLTNHLERLLHVLYFISLNFSYYMWHHSKWCSKIKKPWDKLLPKVSWRE